VKEQPGGDHGADPDWDGDQEDGEPATRDPGVDQQAAEQRSADSRTPTTLLKTPNAAPRSPGGKLTWMTLSARQRRGAGSCGGSGGRCVDEPDGSGLLTCDRGRLGRLVVPASALAAIVRWS
jgi:hypothetical protein